MAQVEGENPVDREIVFDVPVEKFELRRGEFEIDRVDSIEETKGNNGEKGSLVVTNLRMIWSSQKNPRINRCIGYNCIISIAMRTVNSRLRGPSQALFLLTKFNSSRSEFIFTSLVQTSPQLFTTVQAVHRCYDSSRMYRDVKLRGAIAREKELIALPKEQVFTKTQGVFNLSSDQAVVGTFVVTSVRVVWFSDFSENFSVSIPYLQLKSVDVRDSKFGFAVVVETTAQSGGYVLGFRVDPVERMRELYKEISTVRKISLARPFFGIELSAEGELLILEDPNKKSNGGGTEDDSKGIPAFESGQWYRWTGGTERPSGWADKMDFLLDGKPHQVNESSGGD
eukprot:RCo050881